MRREDGGRPLLIDAHAHLRASPPADSEVALWVVPGVDAARDAEAHALAAQDPRLRCAVGLHPWFLPDGDAALAAGLAALEVRAGLPGVVAIGETGLDRGRRAGPRAVQERAFTAQIALARRLGLPLILHVVGRHGACLRALREAGFPASLGGMVHDFGGPLETIPEWRAAGFCLSISPRSLRPASTPLDDRAPTLRPERLSFVRAIPDDSLLVETDDAGIAGLQEVVAAVASARASSPEAIAVLTAVNARRCLRL